MDVERPEDFEQRKRDHLLWALDDKNEAFGESGFERVHMIHNALPEIDFSSIDIKTKILNQTGVAPFFVSSMTGGHSDSQSLNLTLAQACAEKNWLMGVGSQRRELYDATSRAEWRFIRSENPNIRLLGNLGLTQLIRTPLGKVQGLIEKLEAVALIIHTNPLQEALQEEGTPNFKGGLNVLEKLCKTIEIPVIFKETGCGFSKENMIRLKDVGLSAIDISGFGGTHWGRVEGCRSHPGSQRYEAAKTFENWGTSTLDSLLMSLELKPEFEVWASGGIRSGLDAAKLLSLGARAVGLAKPMMQAAMKGYENLVHRMEILEFELKVAMFCTGSLTIQNLRENKKCQIRGK